MINQFEAFREALEGCSAGKSSTDGAVVDDFLNYVARTGRPLFAWELIQPALISKLEQTLHSMVDTAPFDHVLPVPNCDNAKADEMIDRIMQAARSLDGIPFTIQRLCELIMNPRKHYRRSDKLFRAIEKNILVVTTISAEGQRITGGIGTAPESLLTNGIDHLAAKLSPQRDSDDMSTDESFDRLPDGAATPFPDTTSSVNQHEETEGVKVDDSSIWNVGNAMDTTAALEDWHHIAPPNTTVLDASANSSTLPTNLRPGPMPSIESLWNPRLDASSVDLFETNLAKRSSEALVAHDKNEQLPPLDVTSSMGETPLDSLSPSINASMITSWLNATGESPYSPLGGGASADSNASDDAGASFGAILPLHISPMQPISSNASANEPLPSVETFTTSTDELPKLHLITDSSSSEVEEPLHSKSADSGLKAVASIRGEEEKPKIESEVGEDFNFLSEDKTNAPPEEPMEKQINSNEVTLSATASDDENSLNVWDELSPPEEHPEELSPPEQEHPEEFLPPQQEHPDDPSSARISDDSPQLQSEEDGGGRSEGEGGGGNGVGGSNIDEDLEEPSPAKRGRWDVQENLTARGSSNQTDDDI